MDHSEWELRWNAGRLGFHQPQGNTRLKLHWEPFLDWCGTPFDEGSSKVLVPLCGKTRDLLYLAGHRHQVLGVEFVERAVQDFFRETGIEHRVENRSGGFLYRFEEGEILVHDFFSLSGAELGRAQFAYDRAALVAVMPERRSEYVATLADLIEPGGGLLLMSFEHDMGSGPPFSVPDVPELFGEHFEVEPREKRDILEEESRFRERGATHMHEVVWYARRKP